MVFMAKLAHTWLVSYGVPNRNCYLHLDDRIAYVKQRDTDVLLYMINGGPSQARQIRPTLLE
jgi:hypothetical protein